MILYSTNNMAARVSFKEAVFNSLPTDKGLYMPLEIPRMDPLFLRNLPQYDLPAIAFEVSRSLLGDAIPAQVLRRIIDEAMDFQAPVKPLEAGLGVLELFHGPSLAFKDFGARFMSRVMGYFSADENQAEKERLLDVLVATSGDTGGAVAQGFLGVKGTRVTILYPKGKVSKIQELQLTSNGGNIRALEIEGTFDDCQALVKQAFNDPELSRKLRLTSANSINISRLIPQTFYYFHAYAQVLMQGIREVVFSVPSGNFGNIGAGVLAYRMGLPVRKFIAATNANDVVPRFLSTGVFQPQPAKATVSNAMDVGSPSNWVRIVDLFGGDISALQQVLISRSYTDKQTLSAMEVLYREHEYLACPHTAIAWQAVMDYRQTEPGEYASVFLATAHPCKFPDIMPGNLRDQITYPPQVSDLFSKSASSVPMPVDFEAFKAYLLQV